MNLKEIQMTRQKKRSVHFISIHQPAYLDYQKDQLEFGRKMMKEEEQRNDRKQKRREQ